jgi:hypothetical protein
MRDDFEKELQDVLSGFNREPDAGAWQAIEKRIGGRAFSFLNPQVLMWFVAVSKLPHAVLRQLPNCRTPDPASLETGDKPRKAVSQTATNADRQSIHPLYPERRA